MAKNSRNCIIYVPFAITMVLDLNPKDIWGINLETQDSFVPRVELKNNQVKLFVLNHNSDSLIVIEI
ncbi:hypothetical protein [Thermotoga sp.]|uniref:hypothetical protein n=1 Tax=Thermotoga sp. TaxID=28240 RepID=UPI0025E8C24D|nr:hypothetical protein [Thermotoga sp.]